jgi:hypothetical protein
MIPFFIAWLGYFLIFAATDVNRKEESKIPLISWHFLLQALLITVGVLLIQIASQPES